MALFKNITLTQAGADMLSAFLGGDNIDPIRITSIGIGDGVRVGDDGAALGHEVRRLAVETGKVENGVLIVTARLSTDQIESDIVHREIGLYSGDTLFAYGNAGDDYDFIPAAGQCTAVIKQITCRLYVGTVNVQIETYKSADYVTYDALEQRINDTIDSAVEDAQAAANAAVVAAQSSASSAAESAKSVNDAVSQVIASPQETPEGNADLAFIWAHLAEIRPGVLEEISFECRHNGTINAPELFLGVWEEDERGVHQKIGVSMNAAGHVTGGYYRWFFDGLKVSGRSLRFLPLAAPEDTEMSGHQFGSWGAPTTDGSFCKAYAGGKNAAYFPHAIFGYAALLDTSVHKAENSALKAEEAAREAAASVAKLGTVMRYKGSVSTFEELPPAQENEIGDFWNILENGLNYAWTGSEWDEVGKGIDLSSLASKKELQEHERDASKHVTNEERAEWANKYTRDEIDNKNFIVCEQAKKILIYPIAGTAPALADREDGVLYFAKL